MIASLRRRARAWWSHQPLAGLAQSVERSLSGGRPWYWKLTLGCVVYAYIYHAYIAHR